MKKTIKYYLILCVLYVIITTLFACNPVKNSNTLPGTTEQQQRFEDCISEFPSDYVCDSCYTAIFKPSE